MKQSDHRTAPRLQFTDEELAAEGLERPIEEVRKAQTKANKARKKLPKRMMLQKEAAADEPAAASRSVRDLPETADAAGITEAAAESTSSLSEAAEAISSSATPEAPISESLLTRSKAARGSTGAKKTALKPGDPPKPKSRLTFDEAPKPKGHAITGKMVKPVATAARAEARHKLNAEADDNVGLEASEAAEQTGESALRFVGDVHQRHELRQYRRAEKAEHKLDQANIHYLQKKDELERAANGTTASNPISRAWQKRQIKKEYMAGRYGTGAGSSAASRTGSAARRSGKQAGKAAKGSSEKIAGFVKRHKGIVIGLAVVGLLIFSVQAISALVPVLESGLSAITAGTYPAEEADVRAAERAYAAKERDLQNELNHYERYHPGYDEYIIEADEIWHDPYALIAIISAYTNGEEWTIDSVGGIIDKFFTWQYEKTERITTEQHYRTEVVDGVETRVWYTKYICTVTLKNKDLSHAPVYTMSREQMGLYALYMSTHGNMDGIFRGGHASELKDPLRYDVPQELIDADPKFALLLEEANKRIGYPYVWGGYTPDTSFDCSGFISWIFTETGVVNIGHRGANGLWSMCRRVSAEEAKPGDIVFFEGTIPGEDGITHCGLYVGNGMMIHCGSPTGYADITKGYYKQHFYAFGRIYEH